MNSPNECSQALPAGTRLEEFVIERVLGSGGFGITYLARDTSLGRLVVIKENLPAEFCFRDTHSLTVAPRHTSAEDVENFRWSLENFAKEAAILASLDHPGIVRVLRSFPALGTAYFVMPFVEGVGFDALIEKRRVNRQAFSEEELMGLLDRMLNALGYLHDRGIYHRDIKPGTLLITNDGVPVLIDFGSARQRLSERSMTVIESPGYTPFEQLQSRGNVGPWSDLYALGATLHKALTGEAPPKTMDRMRRDPRVSLVGRAELVESCSVDFLHGIDKALELEEADRWQDAREWLAALRGKTFDHADALMTVPKPAPMPKRVIQRSDTSHAPESFALIPAGEFQMGDALDGMKDAPVHVVYVNAFYMAKHEVTKSLWDKVRVWARKHGYAGWFTMFSSISAGKAKAANHPVHSVTWHDVVKWCNARSEMEGLTPCYTVTGTIYRTGYSDAVVCDWNANGYRLPTEAEWEKAARGGLDGKRFPFGDTIGHGQANFRNEGKEIYQTGTIGFHPTHKTGNKPYTSPVQGFPANGYGLFNTVGNVSEWCWDRYGSYLPTRKNPCGATSGRSRVYRGGSWNNTAFFCRLALRRYILPICDGYDVGFRVARGSVP